MTERVVCFIDGLNLYHSIHNLNEKFGRDVHYLKWINLRAIAEIFVLPQSEKLVGVYNFTAYATHIPDVYRRHRDYVKALDTVGVKTILGNFKDKKVWVRCCENGTEKVYRETKEEKESDPIIIHRVPKNVLELFSILRYIKTASPPNRFFSPLHRLFRLAVR